MILQTPPSSYSFDQFRATSKRADKGVRPTFKAIIVWHLAIVCYYLCQSSCNGEPAVSSGKNQLVDLSYEFSSETIYYGYGKPLTITVTHNGTVDGANYWRQSEEIAAATHGGTHLDAPCHFVLGRWCTSDIPLENLVAPAVVIDISSHVGDDPAVHLRVDHLTAWESVHGLIPEKSVLLLRTGWSKFWPDKQRYTGTSGKDPVDMDYPSVEPEAAQWLVDNRNILGFGIDTLSVDIARSPDKKTHRILEDKNIYGIENVNDDLKLLPPTGATVFVMPMKLKDTSGAPCRVIAMIPASTTSDAKCQTFSCNAIVTAVTVSGIYYIWLTSTT